MRDELERTVKDHDQIVQHYRQQCAGEWVKLVEDDYARQHLCAHLYGAQQFSALFTLVAESDAWAKARYQREGDYTGYLGDLNLAWRWAESDAAWDVARQVRCLLIQSTIQGLSVPPTWDPESAIQWFLRISARDLPPEACPDALAIAQGIVDIDLKAGLLGYFAADLPEPFRNEALAALLDTGDSRGQSRALVMRLRDLPAPLREAGIQTVLAALPEEDDSGKAFTLSYLGPVLPDDLKPRAFDVAQRIEDLQARADAFADLATPWSGEWRERAMEAALEALRAIPDESYKVVTLARYLEQWAPNVPASELLEEFFLDPHDPYWRLAALTIVLPFLRAERVVPLTIEALEAAAMISAAEQRAGSLLPFLGYPLGEVRVRVLEAAWLAARSIVDPEEKPWFFRGIIRKLRLGLEDDFRTRAIAEARDTIRLIDDLRLRVIALEWLARDVPEIQGDLYQEALHTAMGIESAACRAGTLSGIALHFAEPLQQTALRLSLTALHDVHDPWVISRVLRELSAHAPFDLMPEVLALAQTIDDPKHRAEVLVYLTAHFPPDIGRRVLKIARSLHDDRVLASVLATLAGNVADESKATMLREALSVSVKLPPGDKREPARSTIFHWIMDAWRKTSFAGASHGDVAQLLHALGQYPLPDMINDFDDYLPLADYLAGPGMLASTVRALRDVLAWWPQPGAVGETEIEAEDSTLRVDVPF